MTTDVHHPVPPQDLSGILGYRILDVVTEFATITAFEFVGEDDETGRHALTSAHTQGVGSSRHSRTIL